MLHILSLVKLQKKHASKGSTINSKKKRGFRAKLLEPAYITDWLHDALSHRLRGHNIHPACSPGRVEPIGGEAAKKLINACPVLYNFSSWSVRTVKIRRSCYFGILIFLNEKSTFSELEHLFILLVSRQYDDRISEHCQIIFQLSVGFILILNIVEE